MRLSYTFFDLKHLESQILTQLANTSERIICHNICFNVDNKYIFIDIFRTLIIVFTMEIRDESVRTFIGTAALKRICFHTIKAKAITSILMDTQLLLCSLVRSKTT